MRQQKIQETKEQIIATLKRLTTNPSQISETWVQNKCLTLRGMVQDNVKQEGFFKNHAHAYSFKQQKNALTSIIKTIEKWHTDKEIPEEAIDAFDNLGDNPRMTAVAEAISPSPFVDSDTDVNSDTEEKHEETAATEIFNPTETIRKIEQALTNTITQIFKTKATEGDQIAFWVNDLEKNLLNRLESSIGTFEFRIENEKINISGEDQKRLTQLKVATQRVKNYTENHEKFSDFFKQHMSNAEPTETKTLLQTFNEEYDEEFRAKVNDIKNKIKRIRSEIVDKLVLIAKDTGIHKETWLIAELGRHAREAKALKLQLSTMPEAYHDRALVMSCENIVFLTQEVQKYTGETPEQTFSEELKKAVEKETSPAAQGEILIKFLEESTSTATATVAPTAGAGGAGASGPSAGTFAQPVYATAASAYPTAAGGSVAGVPGAGGTDASGTHQNKRFSVRYPAVPVCAQPNYTNATKEADPKAHENGSIFDRVASKLRKLNLNPFAKKTTEEPVAVAVIAPTASPTNSGSISSDDRPATPPASPTGEAERSGAAAAPAPAYPTEI